MSFILDALRKSETERQRQSGPGLVDAGYRPPARQKSPWPAVVAVVLTANLALMAWYLLREPAPAPATPPVAAAPAASTAPAAAPPAAPPAARSLADAAGVAPPEDGPYDATADLPALDPGAPAAATEPLAALPADAGAGAAALAPPAPEAVPPPAGSGRVADDLPSAAQVMESGAIPYKDLHLDIHVWSDKPEERFVFINMRKYGEGAVLPEGPRIDAITRDGVSLSQDGQRFVLTRD